MKRLFATRGFGAFILVAFINAFVDLGHKITIQNTLFKSFDGQTQIILTAITNALILLPFILLFTPSGWLSDRFSKARVMRLSAAFAIVITLLITLCYYQGWFTAAFVLTFILAMQSAFYSPAKYGYIRELLGEGQLSMGNSWQQATSMIAILAGSACFSALFELLLPASAQLTPEQILPYIAPLGWLLVAGCVIEFLLTLRMPNTFKAANAAQPFDWNNYLRGKTQRQNLKLLFSHKAIWQPVLGMTSVFSISQVLIAVFPAYAKAHLAIHNTFIIQSIIAMAIIGLMLGSAIAGRLSRDHINLALIPCGAVGVTLGCVLLPLMSSQVSLALVFTFIGLSAALLTIPFVALIQFHANESQLGRILAGNNFIQNLGMLLFLLLTVSYSLSSWDPVWILWALAAIAAVATLCAIVILPEALLRGAIATLLSRRYRLKVLGLEHLPEAGQGTLLLGNHISWLDWAMVQMACPQHVYFVMDRTIYQRWYLKWFFDLYKVIPISSGQNRDAMAQIEELLNAGEVVCLFPEGSISHLGQLGEFKKGFEKACKNASGVIIPFYLRGMWGSFFSRASQKLSQLRRSGLKRDVVVAFGEAMPINSQAEQVKQAVFNLSIRTWNDYAETLQPIAQSWIQTAKARPTEWAITDAKGQPQSHLRLLTGATRLSKPIRRLPGQNLGLLLPTSTAGVMANMAALMAGKTLVNLNYTASPQALQHALEAADIQAIVTAHRFIKQLAKRGVDTEALLAGKTVLYLEEFQQQLSRRQLLTTLIMLKLLPTPLLQWFLCQKNSLDDTAAILFSSGSEGAPKGVMLSHRNIMANVRQVSDVLNVRDQDRIMATLPLFHAFGLTVTGILPMVEGIPLICHPDPTDSLNIGRAVAKYEATLMCATSTFLRLYARNRRVHPLMFSSLRAVVAGAEKLDPQVKESFQQKFMVPIIEGYGTTETTPVASVNLPAYLDRQSGQVQEANRPGTVGMAVPGSAFKIVDPQTLEPLPIGCDGLILIGGAQIMQGYLNDPKRTAEAITEIDGLRWYKTGDKGHLDQDGYLTIVDRYSRFAKLGGEMVSLGAVEQQVRDILQQPDIQLVAMNLPDAKKGEKVVLLIDADESPEQLRQQLTEGGMPALMLPAVICHCPNIPVLGSGKIDYQAARKIALELA